MHSKCIWGVNTILQWFLVYVYGVQTLCYSTWYMYMGSGYYVTVPGICILGADIMLQSLVYVYVCGHYVTVPGNLCEKVGSIKHTMLYIKVWHSML